MTQFQWQARKIQPGGVTGGGGANNPVSRPGQLSQNVVALNEL